MGAACTKKSKTVKPKTLNELMEQDKQNAATKAPGQEGKGTPATQDPKAEAKN